MQALRRTSRGWTAAVDRLESTMKKYLRFAAFTAGTTLAGTWIAVAQEAPAPAGDASSQPHTLADDGLARFASAEPGETRRWTDVFALNHEAVPRPGLIAAGIAFGIQSAAAASAPVDEGPPPAQAPAPAVTHTVAAGEGLSGIAQSMLGASARWVEILRPESGRSGCAGRPACRPRAGHPDGTGGCPGRTPGQPDDRPVGLLSSAHFVLAGHALFRGRRRDAGCHPGV